MFQFAQTVSPYFLSTTALNDALAILCMGTGPPVNTYSLYYEVILMHYCPCLLFQQNQTENALSYSPMICRSVSHCMTCTL